MKIYVGHSNDFDFRNELYMQKYCGCIFSEEDRYSKQIKKDKENNLKGI